MATPVDAIQRFFNERNRSWITNDTTALKALCGRVAARDWWHRMERGFSAKQHEMHVRRKRLVKAHSQVYIRTLDQEGDGWHRAVIDEMIYFVYRDGSEYNVESRAVRHVQSWKPQGKGYILEESDEDREWSPLDAVDQGQAVGDRDHVAQVDDPHADITLYPPYLRACKVYDRVRCQRYADLWWSGHNPDFAFFTDDDCTNYASQCLYAGRVPMTGHPNRANGWWYQPARDGQPINWSYSWSTAHALYLFLMEQLGAVKEPNARHLSIGDLVFYDWDGSGRFHHTTVVTDFDASGDPLVNAHSIPSFHRHYLYLDSPAWTGSTTYAFVHIPRRVCD